MSPEKLATAGVVSLAGFLLSAWIIYLDYRRRIEPSSPEPAPTRRRGVLHTGLALLLAGVGLGLATGGDPGWSGVLGCLAVTAGSALVAIHVTRFSQGTAGGGERGSEKETVKCPGITSFPREPGKPPP